MAKIDYSCLKGRIDRFAPAPSGNPHLWLLVHTEEQPFFATINVQSSKGLPGSPEAESFLYFLVEDDFRHPVVAHLRGLDDGMTRQERSYGAGALDFVKGNLFDPRRMRVLPSRSAAGNDLFHRIEGLLDVARTQGDDIVIVGSQFRTSADQTTAVLGSTPSLGIDNTHMAQGDPAAIDAHLHENGTWHDGAIFLLSKANDRVTAIFLAFQTQSWQTDGKGQAVDGTTGYEAPRYDFSDGGLGELVPVSAPVAELTSLNRLPDGSARLVVANMSTAELSFAGWSVVNASGVQALPNDTVAAGQPLVIDLGLELVDDAGGILSLIEARGLKMDGVAYPGGPASGWSSSFS